MITTQDIVLDVNTVNFYKTIGAKQADDNSRYLKVRLVNKNELLNVPINSTVVLRTLKPDGTSTYNNGTVNSDGTVTVELTVQVLAVAGNVVADISVIQGGAILSTATFNIEVQPVPLGTEIESSNEFTALIEVTERAEQAIAELMTAVKITPQTLTDQQKEQARENINAQSFAGLYVVNNKICMEVKQ